MADAARRRRKKHRRAIRAAEAAERALRVAAAEPRPGPPIERVADIRHLRVSAADVVAAGTVSHPMRWVVARCAALSERKIMGALEERKIVAYMPMHRLSRRLRNAWRPVERPLLVGYLFVGLAPHQSIYDLVTLNGIEGVLQRDGATAFISPWTILEIALLEERGAFDHVARRERQVFAKDQLVRIVSGWAAGHQAKVVEAKDGGLRVQFEGIFRGRPVPVSRDQVEPVDTRQAA